MIIDPWGTVLCTCPDGSDDGPNVALAPIDLARVERFRSKLPCIEHERPIRVTTA